jgi:hypothetical protein
MRSGFDKVRRACPLPMGQSTLFFLLHALFLPGTPCFCSLPHSFFRVLRLPSFALHGYLHCGIFASACLLCRLLVNVPFCCYTRLLLRRICWLLPLVQTLSLALFSLSLPRGLNNEGQPKKHILLSRRRHLLPSFWLHSSVVRKSVGFRLSSARMTWFLPETLGAYMLWRSKIGTLQITAIMPQFARCRFGNAHQAKCARRNIHIMRVESR